MRVTKRTLDEMTTQGFRVDISYRPPVCAVHIQAPDGRTAQGISICGTKDTFNKRIGRSIALGRALSSLQITQL